MTTKKTIKCDCPRCGDSRATCDAPEINPVTGFENWSDIVDCPKCGAVSESFASEFPLL